MGIGSLKKPSLVLVIIADGERPSYPGQARPAMDTTAARRNAHRIDQAMAELLRLVPDAGSYISESNHFNASWQNAYCGGNYSRLRAIKAKYDPKGLFFVITVSEAKTGAKTASRL